MRKGWHIKIAAKCPLGSWVQYDFSQVSEIDMQVYRSLNAPEYIESLVFNRKWAACPRQAYQKQSSPTAFT